LRSWSSCRPVADAPPHRWRILADAAGEDDGVEPAHRRGVGADIFAGPVGVDLYGELRVGVALGSHVFQIAHVGGAGQPFQAAVVVKRGLDVRDRKPELPVEEAECSGIDIAGARSHDQAFQRGHAHGAVEAPAPVDRADARAVAEMHAHDLEVRQRTADLLGGPKRDVFVRGAMEAVAAKPGVAP
jgi:hypothetical protein